jgi:hypothetical protein
MDSGVVITMSDMSLVDSIVATRRESFIRRTVDKRPRLNSIGRYAAENPQDSPPPPAPVMEKSALYFI